MMIRATILFITGITLVAGCKVGSLEQHYDSSGLSSSDTPVATLELRCDSGGEGWFRAYRRGTPSHTGIDYKCKVGEPIVAWGDGKTLRASSEAGGYGHWTETRQTINGKTLTLFFGHLDRSAPRLSSFKKGDVIGYCGRSGNISGGIQTHVHFEVGPEGRTVDPVPALNSVGIKVKRGSCSRI